MKFSKAWLSRYIKELLPVDEELVRIVTENAFEVESVEIVDGDTVFDIKILPNRAHDALAHRGMAKEIAALCDLTFTDPFTYWKDNSDSSVAAPEIQVEDEKKCSRFMGVRIDGVKVEESPTWLKAALSAIGQKSINSIVDVTNFVQFSINKPMHAYDAALVEGNTLKARMATLEEKLTTLDNKEIELTEDTLIIADTKKPLGLAGIKGGKFSGVSDTTTSLIIESANFNSQLVRATSQKYGIRTDASKRFENELSDTLVEEGMRMTIGMILELNKDAKVSPIINVGAATEWKYVVSFTLREVNALLGTIGTENTIEDTLRRLRFTYTKKPLRQVVEEKMIEVKDATYKNPSGMRADAPQHFSCSSLVSYLYQGVWQPSISIDKYAYGEKVNRNDLRYGDLIFSNSGKGRIRYETVDFLPGTKIDEGIDHVGMYLDNDEVFHISSSSLTPIREKLSSSNGFKGTLLYARFVDFDEPRYFVTIPHERLDLRIKEDLIEEIARIRGLSNIKGILPDLHGRIGSVPKRYHCEMLIRNALLAAGFSEVYTYSFGEKGEVVLKKALTDKNKLRTNLSDGLIRSFFLNYQNRALLNLKDIRIFEFGNVFSKKDESRRFAMLIDDGAKKSSFGEEGDFLLAELKECLGVDELEYEVTSNKPYCVEVDIDKTFSKLNTPKHFASLRHENEAKGEKAIYSRISPYPHIVRDVALWAPEGVTWESIKIEIDKVLSGDKELLAREVECFDQFTKDRKTSYAFRMVLQSFEKTLTDEEANAVANKVYEACKALGYEVR